MSPTTLAPPTAEEAVLGAILLDPSTLDRVRRILDPDDFERPQHRHIFQAISECAGDETGDVSVVSLMERLKRKGLLDRCGGPETLVFLSGCVPSAASAESSANLVREAAIRRELVAAGKELAREGAAGREDPLKLRDRLLRRVEGLDYRKEQDAPAEIQPWVPFPTQELPEPFASFVRSSAAGRQCDEAAVALPLLSALAATIGNSRVVRIWPDWHAPAILWTALVCPSGAVKTPAFRAALGPVEELDQRARAEYDEEMKTYGMRRLVYEADLAQWKRQKGVSRGEPPEEPDIPTLRRRICEDATLQALGHVLHENPKGVLLARDELSGWVRSFDQFTSSSGADVARWLEIYRAGPLRIDRVKAGSLYVRRAAVSVCGTLQDEVLLRAFSGEHRINGLLSRFLLARPMEPTRKWAAGVGAPPPRQTLAKVFRSLDALPVPADGERPPALVLSKGAAELYGAWFDKINERRVSESSDLIRATQAKIEEAPARIALVMALARATDPEAVMEVDGDTMRRSLAISDWFESEGRRVLGLFSEGAAERDLRVVVEWVGRRGGASARDLYGHGPRRWRGRRGAARRILAQAVALGLLVQERRTPSDNGGRPTEVFHVPAPGDGDETSGFKAGPEVLSPDHGDETPGFKAGRGVLSPSPASGESKRAPEPPEAPSAALDDPRPAGTPAPGFSCPECGAPSMQPDGPGRLWCWRCGARAPAPPPGEDAAENEEAAPEPPERSFRWTHGVF